MPSMHAMMSNVRYDEKFIMTSHVLHSERESAICDCLGSNFLCGTYNQIVIIILEMDNKCRRCLQ